MSPKIVAKVFSIERSTFPLFSEIPSKVLYFSGVFLPRTLLDKLNFCLSVKPFQCSMQFVSCLLPLGTCPHFLELRIQQNILIAYCQLTTTMTQKSLKTLLFRTYRVKCLLAWTSQNRQEKIYNRKFHAVVSDFVKLCFVCSHASALYGSKIETTGNVWQRLSNVIAAANVFPQSSKSLNVINRVASLFISTTTRMGLIRNVGPRFAN